MEPFRVYLQQEFLRRNSANNSYSLRSFARSMGIHHATLSQILSGQRKVTRKTFEQLSEKLNLSFEQRTELTEREPASPTYLVLQKDAFASLSEWYFDAILEMCRIPRIKISPQLIANATGISLMTAKMALQTLVRLGLLEKTKNDSFRLTIENTTNILDPDLTSAAQKRYQLSVLEKSAEAINQVARPHRDHTSLTLAIKRKNLPRAKELIKKFRREFDQVLSTDGLPDEVYQLQIGFFPITNLKGDHANE